MTYTLPLLLAIDAGNVFRIVLLLLFFAGPAIWRMLVSAGKAQQQGRQIDVDELDIGDAEVEAEIEQFLREAGVRQGEAEPAVRAEPVVAEVVVPRLVGGGSEHDRDTFDERASHLGETVGLADEKIEDHLHSVFDHQLGRLADTSVDAHQEQPTDRAAEIRESIAKTPTTAAGLVSMLGSKQSLRQAILLSEILTPPDQRRSPPFV